MRSHHREQDCFLLLGGVPLLGGPPSLGVQKSKRETFLEQVVSISAFCLCLLLARGRGSPPRAELRDGEHPWGSRVAETERESWEEAWATLSSGLCL